MSNKLLDGVREPMHQKDVKQAIGWSKRAYASNKESLMRKQLRNTLKLGDKIKVLQKKEKRNKGLSIAVICNHIPKLCLISTRVE